MYSKLLFPLIPVSTSLIRTVGSTWGTGVDVRVGMVGVFVMSVGVIVGLVEQETSPMIIAREQSSGYRWDFRIWFSGVG
jgi:hypothetical protein